ncbi:MAG: GAF domain-containing protein [Bryobacterales bacterium]|nr:GAF domain-containing protein [Bryobacterales bacterium]
MPKARELEHRLELAEAHIHLHQSISRYLVKPVSLHDALTAVVGSIADFTHADSCLLYLLSHGELVLCAARGPNPAAVGEVRLQLDEGLTGWVARERRMLAITREAYLDPRFKYFSNLPEDSFEAFLSVPILVKGRVVGVLNVQHRNPHSHSGDEMETINAVGHTIGALIALSFLDIATLARADLVEIVLGPRVGVQES